MRFKLSTYTATISNPISKFLIKIQRQIGLFTYLCFNKKLFRQLYHIHPDYFNPYKEHYSFKEYKLRGLNFFASRILNHSKIFI